MSARDNILARIRQRQGRSGATSEAELQAARDHIALHALGPLPAAASTQDLVAQFKSECARLLTTVAEVPSLDGLPQAVADYLATLKADGGDMGELAGYACFAALGWQQASVAFAARPAAAEDRIGLTDCFCAIAETGTLLLLSAKDTPKVTALLPETHICLVPKTRIVATMEDAFALVREEAGEPPRSMYFVSGPSRTADIEQTIVIGAHGPYRVHVILV